MGHFRQQHEICEGLRRRAWHGFAQDLLYAVRGLTANPRFSLTAILTLALGLGANTAIFSTVDAVLFRPMPVPKPEQLASVHRFDRKASKYVSASWPEYEYLVRNSSSFQHLSAYVRLPLRLTVGDRIQRMYVEAVTANYFEMLRLDPAAGRAFRREDEDAAQASPVAMISESLWRTRFNADPGVLNRSIALQDRAFRVIGIVPERYHGLSMNWGEQPQIWILVNALPVILPAFAEADLTHQRGGRWLLLHGRLRENVSLDTAESELRTLSSHLEQEWPEVKDIGIAVIKGGSANFWPGHRDQITKSLAIFAASALLILLMACTNVSSLLLERMLARQREIAVRLSIGASRGRLIRQLMTENLVLAVPSVLAALGVAFVLQQILLAFPNAIGAGLTLELGIDWRVFSFCVALAVLSIGVFGLAPAVMSTRSDLISSLRTSGGMSGGQATARRILTISEVALSMMLLVAGGLFARTLLKAYSANPGFDKDKLLVVSFDLPPEDYRSDKGQATIESLRQAAAVPGVESVTLTANIPLSAAQHSVQFRAVNDPAAVPVNARANVVGPEYLRTLGIPSIAGREFTAHNGAGSDRVVIVNQTLARTLWPDRNPVGQAIAIERGLGRGNTFQVVGVARDVPYQTVWDKPEPYVYFSSGQIQIPTGHLLIRTSLPPASLVSAIRQRLESLHSRAAIVDIITGDALLDLVLTPQRVASGLIGASAVLAIVLAAVGLFGLVSYSIRQRTREIAVRVALGATPGRVLREILRQSMGIAVGGILLGAVGAAVIARGLTTQIHDISIYDAVTWCTVALLLAVVMCLSSLAPAWRAARLNPGVALKSD